jgi:DNA repair ATPase RecN
MLKVKIKNFQSVADTEFEVDGFTVIVGKNNRGKSAVVRAIDSALSNRLGNNFIRWGKLQTEVGLIKDDLDLSWIKEEKTASYNINKKPYTSLNRAVPQPILDAGYKKFEIGDEKLNPLIAHQFEELFLINRSGPFVTEAISTIYDLNDINDADTLCQKKLRSSKNLLKTRNADAESLSEKIKNFDGLDDVKQKWETIKKLIKKSELLKESISEIDQFIFNLEKQKILIDNLKEVNKLKIPDIKKPRQLIDDFGWLDTTIKNFHKSLQIVQKLKEVCFLKIPELQETDTFIQNVLNLISWVGELKEISLSCDKCVHALENLKNLDTINEKLKEIESQVDSISYLIKIEEDFSSKVQSFKELKFSYDSAVQELNSSQIELNSFKVCPLCNNPLTTKECTHG